MGEGAFLIVILALFFLLIYGIEFFLSLLGYGIMLILIVVPIFLVANAIAYIIDLIKNKKIIEPIIIIALFVFFAMVNVPYINKFQPFGFEFTMIAKKILGLGIIGLGVFIREYNNNDLKEEENIRFILLAITTLVIIVCSVFLISQKSFNKTFFVSQNSKMEIFWENQRIKKEAKKLNLRSELELILKEYQNDNSLEFSRDGINKIIAKFGYANYNGIVCYAIEDEGDNWLVGMRYGEVLAFFASNKNLGNTGNYFVDKNTFEITSVYSETKPQN